MASNKELATLKAVEARTVAQKAKYIANTLYDIINDLDARAGEIPARSELLLQYRKQYDETMMEACGLWAKSDFPDRSSQIKVLMKEMVALSAEFDELTVAITQAKTEMSKQSRDSESDSRICCQLSICEDVSLWFDHLEDIMSAADIQTEARKFAVLRSLLDEEETLIIESVTSGEELDPTPYTSSKKLLLDYFQSTTFQRLDRFFNFYQTDSSEKPDKIHSKLDKLVGPFSRKDVMYWKILKCLPTRIDTHSLEQEGNLKSIEQLTRKIDRIVEDNPATNSVKLGDYSIQQDGTDLVAAITQGEGKEIGSLSLQDRLTSEHHEDLLASGKPKNDSRALQAGPVVASEKFMEDSFLRIGPDSETSKFEVPTKLKVSSRIAYDEDQWSPLNPRGKRRYSSNFLRQFQYRAASLIKPKNLHDKDIVLDRPHLKINPPAQQRGARKRQRESGLNADITSTDEEIVQKFCQMLNKMTRSNFTEVLENIRWIKIDKESTLKVIVEVMFEKAVEKPELSDQYARMCCCLSDIMVGPTERSTGFGTRKPARMVEFLPLLSAKIQREFERDESNHNLLLKLEKEMKENTDLELIPQLKEEHLLAKNIGIRILNKILKSIHFIGEIYKSGLMSGSLMDNCIMTLFKVGDDAHLEALCLLLRAMGKDLDHLKMKLRMDHYFGMIMELIQSGKTSSQVRSSLQDIHDLRSNNWLPVTLATEDEAEVQTPDKPAKYPTISHQRRTDLAQCSLTDGDAGEDETNEEKAPSSASVRQQMLTPPQQEPTHEYNTSINEQKLRQKSESILEEFMNIVDIKEATKCIEELNAPPSMMHAFVYVAHELTLDKGREERVNIGRLMAHLLKQARLPLEQYITGLAELLEMGSNYEIDIPKVWQYFAEQLSPVFEENEEATVPLNCLAELAKPLRREGKSGIFVAEVVKALTKRMTIEDFTQRWHESDMQWSHITLTNEDFVEKFLVEHNLSELSDSRPSLRGQSGTSPSPTQQAATDEQFILERDIKELLDDDPQNEDIFAWIGKNVKTGDLAKPPFLCALTTALCKKVLEMKDEKRNIEGLVAEHSVILKTYVNADPERELQVLYSLQRLVISKQPASILQKIFNILYYEDVISEHTYRKWETSGDEIDCPGAAATLLQQN